MMVVNNPLKMPYFLGVALGGWPLNSHDAHDFQGNQSLGQVT